MSKPGLDRRKMRQKLSTPNTECQTEQTENGDRSHVHLPGAQSETHNQRDRNRHGDRENAPRTFRQRLNDDQREHRQQNNHDRQHTDEREHADSAADLFLHHLPERFSTAPHRREQDNHVVHCAAKRRADQNPKRSGQKSELRRQHRTDQRSRSGDRREVMTKNHPTIRRNEIFAIVFDHRRRGALVI